MTLARKRALLVWELGDNFGHVGRLVRVAQDLEKRGIGVFMAIQNIPGVAPLLVNTDFTILPSPYARVRPVSESRSQVLTYADELRPCGYENPMELAALLRAWRGMYHLVRPDILVANSSPTALLAAKGYPMPRVAVGSGYDIPPLSVPLPPFRFWEVPDTEKLMCHESRVCNTINMALASLQMPPITALKDILETDCDFITTFPELDHYAGRVRGEYVGPFFIDDKGVAADWLPRESARKRIFAYLSHGLQINAAIQVLRNLPHDIILVARRLTNRQAEALSTQTLRVYTDPVQVGRLTADADLCITHGGASTCVQFLMKGVPQILLPNHIEQLMFSLRLGESGAGIVIKREATGEDIHEAVTRALTDISIKEKAQDWQKKYSHYKAEAALGRIGERIAEILAKNA